MDFISLYPESEYFDEVTKMRDKVVDKLESQKTPEI
jgi:outer membrane protein assembly factor BamD (BamD/ComL family)